MNTTVCKPMDAAFGDASRGPSADLGYPGTLHRSISRAVRAVATWRQRARQRRYLVNLDARLLADIGLTEADVAFEASKPFWKA